MVEDIIEHIRKAQLEAQKQHFKANTIIIDTELAHMNNLYSPTFDGYSVCPPMIMGLEVKYQTNLTEEYGVNFILTKTHTQNDEIGSLRKENEMLKEKLEKLKEILGAEDNE